MAKKSKKKASKKVKSKASKKISKKSKKKSKSTKKKTKKTKSKKAKSSGSSNKPASKPELVELELSSVLSPGFELSGVDTSSLAAKAVKLKKIKLDVAAGKDTIEVTKAMRKCQGALEKLLGDMKAPSVMELATLSADEAENAVDGEERIIGTAIGLRTNDGMPTGEPAVKVFINRRAMRAGRRISEDIPTEIDGMPVDVQVMGEIKLHGFSQQFPRPVPSGVSICNASADTRLGIASAGTLGALARLDNNKLCLITNNHVIGNNNMGLIGSDRITQPGLLDLGQSTDVIGLLERIVHLSPGSPNRVDGAAAHTASSVAQARHVSFKMNPTPLEASVNMTVIKDGRTTGSTSGQVIGVGFNTFGDPFNSPIHYPGIGNVHFADQIVVQGANGRPFSEQGDSGAMVVSSGTKQPIGMLFAGNPSFTIVNPIAAVMQELGISEFIE